MPESEQGFWVVAKNTYDNDQNITYVIKINLDVAFLAFDYVAQHEMIPSFGLQQIFLDIAFPHTVKIKPVIDDLTPKKTRKASLARYRNIAVPFPGNELPKTADMLAVPFVSDFMFHDYYHAV